LVFAIVPRLINLCHVWLGKNRAPLAAKVDFWLNVFAVVTALVNAFVHSRDAYAAIPDAVWLSVATVVAMAVGRIVLTWQNISFKEFGHE
jgi:undecaprenyl pyrophosphate phosphatase UppP